MDSHLSAGGELLETSSYPDLSQVAVLAPQFVPLWVRNFVLLTTPLSAQSALRYRPWTNAVTPQAQEIRHAEIHVSRLHESNAGQGG